MKSVRTYAVSSNRALGARFALLDLVPVSEPLSNPSPGQFVQVDVDTPGVFLRRPVSIHRYDAATGRLWLLVRNAGRGTNTLCNAARGRQFSLMGPLGNGFDTEGIKRPLLVGGGVGVAPMAILAEKFLAEGVEPCLLQGARTGSDVLEAPLFKELGPLHIATDDGSEGFHGLVGDHPLLQQGDFDMIYVCGPLQMMQVVARVAQKRGIPCQVSLENKMACGVGACLCCVEKTVDGNLCACTSGPVFNIDQLLWNQI